MGVGGRGGLDGTKGAGWGGGGGVSPEPVIPIQIHWNRGRAAGVRRWRGGNSGRRACPSRRPQQLTHAGLVSGPGRVIEIAPCHALHRRLRLPPNRRQLPRVVGEGSGLGVGGRGGGHLSLIGVRLSSQCACPRHALVLAIPMSSPCACPHHAPVLTSILCACPPHPTALVFSPPPRPPTALVSSYPRLGLGPLPLKADAFHLRPMRVYASGRVRAREPTGGAGCRSRGNWAGWAAAAEADRVGRAAARATSHQQVALALGQLMALSSHLFRQLLALAMGDLGAGLHEFGATLAPLPRLLQCQLLLLCPDELLRPARL